MEQFNIPVVLFCFKRTDTTKRVLEAIRKVQPRKMYILADQGRTAQEKEMAAACRNMVESEIDWPCEVIKITQQKTGAFIKTLAWEPNGYLNVRQKLYF